MTRLRGVAVGGPLRVGLVCPYSLDTPGGVQNHVLGLARHLREQGHDPRVLAPGEPVGPGCTSAGTAVPVRYNGSVARVNFGPLSAARVRRWLRDGDFDLVHLQEPVTPSISMLALWAAEVPVVATFHTATPRSRSMSLAGGALRGTIEKIDAGIAVSESARLVVVQHLGRDAVVVPNGFRWAEFAVPGLAPVSGPGADGTPRWRGGSAPRVSFLGRRDEPRKGLDTLLGALPELRRRFPGIEVVVAGEGDGALPAGCRALGIVSDAEKAALLATSDVFVAPHRERESFGIVLLEAMAAGAAVVASDLPAFRDLLAGDSGEPLGLTFGVGDAAALAGAVGRALARPLAERTAAARAASRRYDWSVVGAEVVEVYRAALQVAAPPLGRPLRARP